MHTADPVHIPGRRSSLSHDLNKYEHAVRNHPEDTPTEMVSQHTGASGALPKAESPENVNVSLLPSFLRVTKSGSHCPLLIFEGKKKIMAEICNNFLKATAQLLGFQPAFRILSQHYALNHSTVRKWLITGKSRLNVSIREIFESKAKLTFHHVVSPMINIFLHGRYDM